MYVCIYGERKIQSQMKRGVNCCTNDLQKGRGRNTRNQARPQWKVKSLKNTGTDRDYQTEKTQSFFLSFHVAA